ncbi:HD domain-containing protein [Selenomonas sp.]|uniref:HD domain-containing protein n=1 Tax=Selenomonas sp. TaxID=2053611 RepID=UPI0025E174E8|nr:HD domain-containing protein [Selenomonas sp.]MCI6085258.1 HD domain-containing protein [Selenomonas sp.]MDY3296708.1 HD domain-containing protein [Selenomonas sp.]MDY4416214.1 HD domain-containing protein [Selenomonas sp.]
MYQDIVLEKMIAFDCGDARRIQHFIKVYAFAAYIGRKEGLDTRTQRILELAAIVHDIGIHAAEEKYHSTAGKYQEQEGPALATKLLADCGVPADVTGRVAFLVGHHHTYMDVVGLDWRILLEADFLVNAYEDQLSESALRAAREKIFETDTGRHILDTMFGLA